MVGLGSAGVGVGLVVSLVDRFSVGANRVATSMNTMTGAVNKGLMSQLRTAQAWGVGMAVVGGMGLASMGKFHSAFRNFDWEMTTVAAVTQRTKGELTGLDTIVKNLAQRSIFNPQEIASASTRLAKAGFNLKQIESAMEGIVFLGTATDTPVGGKTGVADMMAKIMKSFDIPANAASHTADVITKAVNSAAMDMEDSFEALKFLGNTSYSLGLSIEDAMAMIAVLANAGVPQGIAGRGLVNALNKIAISVSEFRTKGSKKALDVLGLHPSDLKDAQGNLLPISQILKTMMMNVSGMGNVDKISALSRLLRLRGERSFLPLLMDYTRSGGKSFQDMLNLLHNVEGESVRIGTQRMESAKGVFTIMGDVWDTFKVTWGAAIDDILTPFFKIITSILRNLITFIKTPVGKWTATLITGFFAVTTVAGIFLLLISSIKMITLQLGSYFAGFFSTLIAGWNAATIATVRYASASRVATQVATGALATSTGFRGAGTAFVTASGLRGPGIMATAAKGKGILAMLGRGFGAFVRFLGPLGMIVTILGMIIGWKNVLKGIVVVIGTVTNVIRLLFDVIMGLFTGKVGEAFDKFTDAQSSLGTKGMFAEPTKETKEPLYKDRLDYYLKSVVPRREKAMYAMKNDPLSLANRQEIKLAMQNDIIVGDDVVQKQVKYYTAKEMNDILN